MTAGTVMVRQLLSPMRIPQALGDDGQLYHADPREAYTTFPSHEAAAAAITRTVAARPGVELEIVSLAELDAEADAEAARKKAAADVARLKKREKASQP